MKKINPVTEVESDIAETSIDDISSIVSKSQVAQKIWGQISLEERISKLEEYVDLLRKNEDRLIETLAEDVGKPLSRGRIEASRAADEAGSYCEKGKVWLENEEVEGGYVTFDPLGVVAVISPWNFPALVPLRGIMPALVAGNSVVFKPSEYAPLSGILLVELFNQVSGVPENLLQIVIGEKDHGRALVSSEIDMVAFTGSTVAGKDIMKSCAERLTKVQLELGGMDAAIVLNDADIEKTTKGVLARSCSNTGQVCCNIKRVYVEEGIYQEFVDQIVKQSEEITFGDPEEDPAMGPLVAKFQFDKIVSIVDDARDKGATIHSGGETPERKGYFYPSTVLTDVTEEMRILSEEPFGPLLPIIPVSSAEEGISKANDSRYGLTGSIWTEDLERGRELAEQLEVGVAKVNSHGPGPFGTPWGGAKESGIGRMHTKEGLREYTSIKTVQI